MQITNPSGKKQILQANNKSFMQITNNSGKFTKYRLS